MSQVSRRKKIHSAINVKIPEFLTDIIDRNLSGEAEEMSNYLGRAHFVESAVIDKLVQLNLLSQKDAEDLTARRTKHISKLKAK